MNIKNIKNDSKPKSPGAISGKAMYFVRHGQTIWNVENKICGASDIALTLEGHEQARRTGEKIREEEIHADEILYSPLIRAKDTAMIISKITGIPAKCEPRLIEQNFGKYESTARDGADFKRSKQNFADSYGGGESMLKLGQRIYNLLDEVTASDKTYILVAHNGIARMVQSYFNDMTNEEYAAYGVPNCSVTKYEWTGDEHEANEHSGTCVNIIGNAPQTPSTGVKKDDLQTPSPGVTFWGREGAGCPALIGDYKGINTPVDLYEALSHIWCADTCAPRMRDEWTKENMTLGQCSITAFLAQDIFGGKVYGVLRPGGNYHCYNVVGNTQFDLTSEQFTYGTDIKDAGQILDYTDNPEQFREIHFAKEEKRQRYEYLKNALLNYTSLGCI